MRSLTADERSEIESIKFLIKYTLSKPEIEDYKIWDAVEQLEQIGKKYVISEIVQQEELDELLDLDDMKELIEKFMTRLINHLKKEEK